MWLVYIKHREIQALRAQQTQSNAKLEDALRTAKAARLALETSGKVVHQLTSILDLHTLLDEVVELIQESYAYYFVGIFLPDEDQTHLVIRTGTGEAGIALCERGVRVKIGYEGVIGWVAAHRRPLIVPDVAEDPRYLRIDVLPDTHSELALPLVVGSHLVGILDIQSRQHDAFNQDDILMLQTLSGQVAVAIQNASLYEIERYQRLLSDKLYTFGQALSRTLDLSEVLRLILKQLADLVPYDRGAVLLKDGDELAFVEAQGFPKGVNPLQIRVKIKENDVFEEIYRTRRPLRLSDVSQREDWEYVDGLAPAQVWLGVPLIRLEDVLGMVSLTREHPQPYSDDDEVLASAFAGQAAIALENARLYESIKRSNKELQTRSQALQVAYKELERLDRTKSDFIKVAAHELRTPLTVIGGYSQILQSAPGIQANAYYRQLVDGVLSGTKRMHEIVNSMLDVAKIDSQMLKIYPQSLSLATLLQLVMQNARKILKDRQLTLKIDDMAGIPDLKADHVALRKVFSHLVENAIKYTPDGGTITISAQALAPGEEGLSEGGVKVTVSDTGIGIDPRYHQQIFSKFYQISEVALHSTGKTKFKGGGPGLGLSIVKGVVNAHGGKVWVESPGYDEKTCPGSTFHVVLPLQPPEQQDGDTEREAARDFT
jgi:signal transduction histidine kinase